MSSQAVVSARQLLAAGRAAEAVAMLHAAGSGGDAAAYMELAIWYLTGERIQRDLAAARRALRGAVMLGHPDGALMEIALAANGSGAPADWRGALALLEQAARNDDVAAQHLAMVRSMALKPDGTPARLPKPELLAERPRIQRFRGFCTPGEAAHIASLVSASLVPASVVDPLTGRLVAHPIRASDNAPIGPTLESLVIQAINRRIAAASETDVTQGEPLTVLRYAPGQQYRPHLDTLPGHANQRIRTAILYLSEGYTGGETEFPLLGLRIAARAGDLLIFDNVDASGAPDPDSRHAGLPVTAGTKWIVTRWIRERPITAWTLSEEARAASRP